MPDVTLRSPLTGKPRRTPAFTISVVRQAPGELVTQVQKKGAVAITNRGRVCAVVLSPTAYEGLVERAGDPLARLSAHYEEEIAAMQTSASKRAVYSLFIPLGKK
jgi:prevent-host-death family protein